MIDYFQKSSPNIPESGNDPEVEEMKMSIGENSESIQLHPAKKKLARPLGKQMNSITPSIKKTISTESSTLNSKSITPLKDRHSLNGSVKSHEKSKNAMRYPSTSLSHENSNESDNLDALSSHGNDFTAKEVDQYLEKVENGESIALLQEILSVNTNEDIYHEADFEVMEINSKGDLPQINPIASNALSIIHDMNVSEDILHRLKEVKDVRSASALIQEDTLMYPDLRETTISPREIKDIHEDHEWSLQRIQQTILSLSKRDKTQSNHISPLYKSSLTSVSPQRESSKNISTPPNALPGHKQNRKRKKRSSSVRKPSAPSQKTFTINPSSQTRKKKEGHRALSVLGSTTTHSAVSSPTQYSSSTKFPPTPKQKIREIFQKIERNSNERMKINDRFAVILENHWSEAVQFERTHYFDEITPEMSFQFKNLLILYHARTGNRWVYWWFDRNKRHNAIKIFDYGKNYPTSPCSRAASSCSIRRRNSITSSSPRVSKSVKRPQSARLRKSSGELIISTPSLPHNVNHRSPHQMDEALNFTVYDARRTVSPSVPNSRVDRTFITDGSNETEMKALELIAESSLLDTVTKPCVPNRIELSRGNSMSNMSNYSVASSTIDYRDAELRNTFDLLLNEFPEMRTLLHHDTQSDSINVRSIISNEVNDQKSLKLRTDILDELSETDLKKRLEIVEKLRYHQQQLLRDIEDQLVSPSITNYENLNSIPLIPSGTMNNIEPASYINPMENTTSLKHANRLEAEQKFESLSDRFYVLQNIRQNDKALQQCVSSQSIQNDNFDLYDLESIKITIDIEIVRDHAAEKRLQMWKDADIVLKNQSFKFI